MHGALALRIAGPVGVGGVGEQQQDAALAVIGEGVEVEELVVGGGGVDLEIAGVDDDAERGGDGQGDGAHDGVRHVNKLDLEGADGDRLLGLDLDQPRLVFEIVLFHAPLHQGEREGRAVDGHVDLGEQIGHGADVVLVAVGEDQRPDLGLVLLEEGQVGHDQIDAQQFGVGEHHSAIDHDDVFAVADGGACSCRTRRVRPEGLPVTSNQSFVFHFTFSFTLLSAIPRGLQFE